MTSANTDWYAPLREIDSLGSRSRRPGSLAGLHEVRKENLAQFFTPDALVYFAWRVVEPAIERFRAKHPHDRVSLLDNSVGSGRMFQYAHPDKHTLTGVDVHADSIDALSKAAGAAGFLFEFEQASMEAVRFDRFGVGLINPPFSIHLESPLLEPSPCTTWGRFGQNTSAISHAYALHQALGACDIVAAVLPTTYAEQVEQDIDLAPRLRAVFHLPRGTFREEGTDVSTRLLVFGREEAGTAPQVFRLSSLDESAPDLGLEIHTRARDAKMRVSGVEDEGPTITLPVTGDPVVRVVHDGRRIKLKFACGLTQAKVLNEVLGERIEAHQTDGEARHRYPRNVRYTGQAALDVETHLTQPDPLASFSALLSTINAAGGRAEVDAGLWGYLHRRIRQHAREAEPFRHTIYRPNGTAGDSDTLTARARKVILTNPAIWGAPVIQAGAEVAFHRVEDGEVIKFATDIKGHAYAVTPDELYKLFEVEQGASTAGWETIYQGLPAAFPEQAHALRKRAISLGIHNWLWKYQLDDLIELSMAPKGAVVAWEMGLGKARLASALIRLNGCKHGLIVVEAGLVPEMIIELEGLPIPRTDWQVITKPSQLETLRQINIISYERLRSPVEPSGRRVVRDERRKADVIRKARITYAHRLRRRINVLVADEGHLLSNLGSDQSRALLRLSAKRRYVLTGSPIANYPRDILPLVNFACGDGTAAQPYGYHRAYMEPRLRTSMAYAMRGIDQFREDFVTLEWVTNEFAENLREGAKREIPKIANLAAYRKFLAPHVKRRVAKEPEVEPYVKIPDPTIKVVEVPWDDAHLGFYLRTADEFAHWYMEARRKAGYTNVNLIAILARIQAVTFASNYPQHGIDHVGSYTPLTSKQRKALEMLEDLTAEGHKTILYAKNPGVLELLQRHLADRGIDSMTYHGSKSIKKRTDELNKRFRFGSCQVLLASVGVTQAGLNLHQADRVIFLDRDWAWKTEYQAMRRVLRPQQKRAVIVYYLHLPGGIDTYQAQMVDFKRDAMNAGLDWGTPELDDVEFLHLDTVLGAFVENLAALHGGKSYDLREAYKSKTKGKQHAA